MFTFDLSANAKNEKRSSARDRLKKAGAALLACSVAAGVTVLQPPVAAEAVTPVYEIQGNWSAGTGNPVKSGTGLTTVWRYNLNDSEAAPENPSQSNVTITFTAQHALFTDMPAECLRSGVSPVSAIQDNGATLVCNLGTRDLGTAELLLAGIQVEGNTGDRVGLSAKIGQPGVNEVMASLPLLDIVNPFAMDMQFSGGTPNNSQDGGQNVVSFPWSLRHAPGSTAGPNSVSYDLTFTASAGDTVTPAATGCTAQNLSNSGYPYSGSGFAASQTAPFPTNCTLTQVSSNRLRLTLTGIDYSKTLDPRRDSTGVALPTEWDVVAAGLLVVRFTYTSPTTLSFTATAPTYTSTIGETSADNPANNSNSVAVTRGVWTGGWILNQMSPPVTGTIWTDTYRTMAGQPVLATSGVRPPTGSETQTQVCTVLDTRYVTFVSTKASSWLSSQPYPGVVYEYFTGTGTGGMVDPNSKDYNPDNFRCDGSTGSNWQSTLPSDLSTVKAIRATFPASANIPDAIAPLRTFATVKSNVEVGQDIWTWTSYKLGNDAWFNPQRGTNLADKPLSGTATPGSRYPFTGGGRDVLRIVAGQPHIDKSVDQTTTMPGATVNFTLNYRVDAPVDTVVNDVDITDALPAGLSYVPGSASIAPTAVNGQNVAWNIDGVSTNTDYTILLSATINGSANPGDTFTNRAEIQLAGVKDSDTAATRVRDGGYTFLTKTVDAQQVPHQAGTASDQWTIRLTSADSVAQSFTDTIDILPYNGDGRGTSFSGSYQLSNPVTAVAGATVYYSVADPATLADDPAHPSNGASGNPAGNTVGWTTSFMPDATAVRVIGPALPAGASQQFTIGVTTSGATFDDIYVNRAEARTSRTQLVMRTSSWFQIAAVNSVTIKKYVQDDQGAWHDAQNIDDYPTRYAGDTVPYRLVVTNTGDQPLTNVEITDDKVDLAALDPLPEGLAAGAVIPELLPGEQNAVVIEYTLELGDEAAGGTLINNACATPSDTAVDQSCDPAGIVVNTSTLAWEKVSAGPSGEHLSGSEWSLVRVNANGDPVAAAIAVTDCIASDAADCSGPDRDPAAGTFRIVGLIAGDYILTETRAPVGYVLDDTPRSITVRGETAFDMPIENEQSAVPQLPLTGGVGTLGFTLVVGGLGAGLVLALWMQRRRSSGAAPGVR
ncbi:MULTISPECIES: DUF7507 domain-containing protein [unclassified Leucobacter]|uniref:DUF7507 domain-containing protein n=1 Tax=unclassified Leucobacter TaxID=2621730 RepID=UPI0030190F1E